MTLEPIEHVRIACPYCGKTIVCTIETALAEQQYIEDCHICCAPIVIRVYIDNVLEQIDIVARKDDE